MTDASPQDPSQRIADAQSFESTCESIAGTFGELLALMPDGIIISDTSGKIVLANPQAEQLFGYERGDLVSLTIERLVPESLRKRHLQQRNAYISSPCSRPMGQGGKLFGCRRQGDQFPVEISLSPMRTEAGLLICAAVRDVTDQRRIEEELLTQRTELTHAARLSTLGEMAAGMAHELNQPLTAMSAFAEGALVRLQRGRLSQTEITSVFSRISADAQRAGDIIKRLRDFVQKRETRRHRIDVNQLIRDSYKFVESDAKHEGITIQFELESGQMLVEADPIEIQQVILNLVRNSHDAVAKNEADERTILISSRGSTPENVEIIVEDSGPGISDSMADQVFEPFYTSKANGLGMGLGICQSIVEAHGGKISIGGSSLGGASVQFDLPSSQQEGAADAS